MSSRMINISVHVYGAEFRFALIIATSIRAIWLRRSVPRPIRPRADTADNRRDGLITAINLQIPEVTAGASGRPLEGILLKRSGVLGVRTPQQVLGGRNLLVLVQPQRVDPEASCMGLGYRCE